MVGLLFFLLLFMVDNAMTQMLLIMNLYKCMCVKCEEAHQKQQKSKGNFHHGVKQVLTCEHSQVVAFGHQVVLTVWIDGCETEKGKRNFFFFSFFSFSMAYKDLCNCLLFAHIAPLHQKREKTNQ